MSDTILYDDNINYFQNRKFSDIWTNMKSFVDDYLEVGIPCLMTSDSAQTLYYLLYARYGNSTIASSDETQFKYKLFAIVFQYGATWEKRLDIQETLRNLTDDELIAGSKQISNNAENPGTSPSTATLEELQYIDSQNTVTYKKSKLDAYSNLMMLLEKDVTGEFLAKFRPLFLTVVAPQKPLWYVDDDE